LTEERRTRQYSVYVVKLRKGILRNRSFKRANPKYVKGKPCVYVGSTSKSPEDRFRAHLNDPKQWSRKVKKYGKVLFEWAYRDLPTYATRDEAERAEAEYAEELRSRGWGVWQN